MNHYRYTIDGEKLTLTEIIARCRGRSEGHAEARGALRLADDGRAAGQTGSGMGNATRRRA